jgi:hypothetical protein
MNITNLAAFDAAIRAVCPIDGVAADGTIFFQSAATAGQIAAAQQAAAQYIDPPQPVVADLALLVQQLVKLGILTPAALAAVQKPAPIALAVPPLATAPVAKPITAA